MATEVGDVISFQVPMDMLSDLMYEEALELEMGNSMSIAVEINEIIPMEDKQLAVVGTVLWVKHLAGQPIVE